VPRRTPLHGGFRRLATLLFFFHHIPRAVSVVGQAVGGGAVAALARHSIRLVCVDRWLTGMGAIRFSRAVAREGGSASGLCGPLFEFGLKYLAGMGKGSIERSEQRLRVRKGSAATDRFNLPAQV
jgi:hypothetical protein